MESIANKVIAYAINKRGRDALSRATQFRRHVTNKEKRISHVFRFLLILFLSASCFGKDIKAERILKPEHDPYFNIGLGAESFLGIVGIEYQNKNHAIGVGYPNRLSYRYFVNPFRDTSFWGMYLGGMSYDNVDETEDGIKYRDLDTKYIGAGGGYRWQWSSGWNTNLSFSVHYYDYEFTNPGSSKRATKSGFFAFPGFNVGYKF